MRVLDRAPPQVVERDVHAAVIDEVFVVEESEGFIEQERLVRLEPGQREALTRALE